MKRRAVILMTCLLVMFASLSPVRAVSGTASVSVSDSSPVVGNKITVTIKLSCSDGVGAAMVYIDYNSSYLGNLSVRNSSAVYANGNKIIVDGGDSKSVTITATLTTKKIGNTSIQVTVRSSRQFRAPQKRHPQESARESSSSPRSSRPRRNVTRW